MSGNSIDSKRTVQLAKSILEMVTNLETHLEENGLPPRSFEPGASPQPLPHPYDRKLHDTISELEELMTHLLGPMGWLSMQISQVVRLAISSSKADDKITAANKTQVEYVESARHV